MNEEDYNKERSTIFVFQNLQKFKFLTISTIFSCDLKIVDHPLKKHTPERDVIAHRLYLNVRK